MGSSAKDFIDATPSDFYAWRRFSNRRGDTIRRVAIPHGICSKSFPCMHTGVGQIYLAKVNDRAKFCVAACPAHSCFAEIQMIRHPINKMRIGIVSM